MIGKRISIIKINEKKNIVFISSLIYTVSGKTSIVSILFSTMKKNKVYLLKEEQKSITSSIGCNGYMGIMNFYI
jgi:hypothetical protein